MASIEKRGPGKWRIRAFIGRSPNGSPRSITRTINAPHTLAGKREAERIGVELDAEAAQRRTLHHADIATVADLMRAWVEHRRTDWAPTTASTTANRIDTIINPAIGDTHLTQLTSADLDRFYTTLATTHSPTSVQRVHAHISGAYALAIRWRIAATNPTKAATPPRAKPANIRLPTEAERDGAWNATVPPRWRAMLRLAILLGVRRSELLGLQWADLDDDLLTINRGITATGTTVHVGPVKTRNERRVSVGAVGLDVIDAWRTATPYDSPWMFPNHRGTGPTHPDRVATWWSRHRDGMGCELVRWHDWRHRAAVTMLTGGVDPWTVATRLGHDPTTLLTRYSHWVRATDSAAADAASSWVIPQS